MASSFIRYSCVALLPVLLLCALEGQEATQPSAQGGSSRAPDIHSGPRSAGSLLSGFNAGVTFSGVHDSSLGWYNAVTPGLSYTVAQRFSADASMSIYPYHYARTSTGERVFDGGDVGDLLLEGHAIFNPSLARNIVTAAMTLPTGDRADGLGTGRVTFSFDDRLERYFGNTGVVIDLGAGDSNGLVNRLVTEDDTSLGPLAQFQAGLVTWLPGNVSLQSVAYEQLPMGDQKTYATVMGPGPGTHTVVTGRRVVEDNGFTTSLYIPLKPRLTLTGSYNRSLRLHLDTVSVGLTLTWKGSSLRRRESLIERAIREAESGTGLLEKPPQ